MIRRACIRDIDQIIEIERTSFPVAWEYSIFLNICLQGGQVRSGETGSLFMDIIEENQRVVGYAVWEIDSNKSKGHLLNLAVHMDERLKGLGTRLLRHVLDNLRSNGIKTCHLEVRASNVPARALYEANGFFITSKIPEYYFDEDAIVYSAYL